MDKFVSQKSNDQLFTFNRRKGTSGISGEQYEIELSLLCLLLGTTNERIDNFHLATNMEEAGDFDDVVFKYKYKDDGRQENTKIIFIQAKHRDKVTKKISFATLFPKTDKGDFCLKKYFDASREIKQQFSEKNNVDHPIFGCNFKDTDFVIYTNTLITYDKSEEGNIKKMDVEKESIFYLKKENNYYYQLTLGGNMENEITDILMYSSDCKKLAKELAECISSNRIVDINKPIFEKYHTSLAESVIEAKKEGIFRKSFLDGDENLAPEVKKFSEVFFEEIQKMTEFKGKSIAELKLELSGKDIKLHEKFANVTKNDSNHPLPSDLVNEDEIKEFLNKLKLFVDQPNQNELREIIKQKMQSLYSMEQDEVDSIYSDVQNKVQKWWKEKSEYFTENHKLFKDAKQNLSKLHLTELTALRCGQIKKLKLTFNNNLIEALIQLIRNKRIINIVTDKSTVLLSSAKVYQALESMDEYKSEKCDYRYISMSLTSVLDRQNKVIDTFKSAESNLLVIECKSIEGNIMELLRQLCDIIKSIDNKRIIFITPENDTLTTKFKDKFSNDDIYEEKRDEKNNLVDLIDESQKILLDNAKVMFQGKEVSLDMLIDVESKYLINAEIVSMLVNNEKIDIGEALFDLGEIKYYYIDRIFNRQVKIKEDFQMETTKFFVIYNSQITQLNFNQDKDIVLIADTNDYFNQLCNNKNHEKLNIHWLKEEGKNFIWQQSRGALSRLREFIDTNSTSAYPIKKITDIADKVVIISAEAGMGKSTVLTKLAKNTKESDPSLWIVRINLNNHMENLSKTYFKENKDEVLHFLLSVVDFKTPFEKELFKCRINDRGKMALLFDGFDEICSMYKDKVIEMLKILKDTKVEKIWITTRPHMRNELEDKLSVLSHTLRPLSKEDQKLFLERFWNKKLDFNFEVNDNRLNNYTEGLLDVQSNSIANGERAFTGISLQIKMLAEAFQDNLKNFLDSDQATPNLPTKLNLVDLYQLFIKTKFDIYCKEKLKLDLTNSDVKEKTLFDNFILEHRLLALNTLFSNRDVNALLSHEDKEELISFKKKVKKGEEKTGIVNQIINDRPTFIHRTFAEYFAADWLANNKDKGNVKDFLRNNIFEKENEILRNFLDRILSQDDQGENKYEIRNAVLNKDQSKLANLLLTDARTANNSINSCDKAGRTVLHLAAANGYEEIVKILFENLADVGIRDNIFNWRPISYADKCNYWNIAELFLKNGAIDDDMYEAIRNVKTIYERKRTLLHLAAEIGYLNFSEALVRKGANINAKDQHGQTPLYKAVLYGKLDVVEYLVGKGADVDAKDDDNRTLLYEVVSANNLYMVEYLVGKGADVDAKNNENRTPLHMAASNGKLEEVTYLVGKGADVDTKDKYNITPLYIAASNGNLDVVEYLAGKGADVDVKNNYNETPLLEAASNGNLDILQYLVEKGADVDAKNNENSSLLHIAASKGKLDVVKYFVGKGADVDAKNNDHRTPLYMAASNGKLDVVEYLVGKGADVNAKNKYNITPLYTAASNGKLDVVEYLVGKGAHADAKDNCNITPLYKAALYGKLNIVEYLVGIGADVDAKDYFNRTLLHELAYASNLDVVEYLVGKGADVNAKDNYNTTPLHEAASSCNLNLVEYFVGKGADVDAKDNDHRTPLHAAAASTNSSSNLDVLEYIVGKGAEVDAKDKYNRTPLHDVVCGNLEEVEYLVGKGADVNVKDYENTTPLHVAACASNLDVVEYLVGKGADVDAKNNDNRTSLHVAALYGKLDVVKYLVGIGADIHAKNNDNKTPLQEAASVNNLDVVEYLVGKGADVEAKDNDNR